MSFRPVKSRFSSRGGRILLVALGLFMHASAIAAEEDPAAAPVVVATGSGPLQTRIAVQRLVTRERPGGETVRQFVEARRLEAGEQLYYTIRVTNPGQEPVDDVVVTKQLPYGVDYVPGSAAGPGCRIEFSLDGGVTFERASGKGAYTHVRWIFEQPIAPGATALLRFRAVFL
jgi:uncharacterized repeat protein (TIGR01451 family)